MLAYREVKSVGLRTLKGQNVKVTRL